jgi:hypothetical protein
MVACGRVVLAVGTWYCTKSTRELSYGAAKRARVWWATGICCGPALGGRDTLGSGGRRGCCGVGAGAASKTSHVGVASRNRLGRKAGAGGCGTDAGNGGGDQGGGTRHILFTVALFECMKRVVCSILCGYWSRGSTALRGR